jgi:hypothetical protein
MGPQPRKVIYWGLAGPHRATHGASSSFFVESMHRFTLRISQKACGFYYSVQQCLWSFINHRKFFFRSHMHVLSPPRALTLLYTNMFAQFPHTSESVVSLFEVYGVACIATSLQPDECCLE